ncbi:elongation factor Ts, mitochondrial [Euwallacea similis]|uniref:elongation factor Ts, mitochondrial n=1 Tax=Euwallacea similis TaxID=1736056 RepID=UPI00344B4D15
MMILKNLTRYIHTTRVPYATEKSALATLRKKTGYTFANCKKALELHNNNLEKAEEWLRQQAQALGWSKATKLEGRQTMQGLIGTSVEGNNGVLVEVNCETDFVARNAEFENMVKEATVTCLNYLKNAPSSAHALSKINLDNDQLKSLKTDDGKSLEDKLALMIGSIGENASLKRAVGVKVANGIHLNGYAHPSGKSLGGILLGRIGGLVAVKSINGDNTHIDKVAAGLCQHIVGMAPKNIGKEEDVASPNKEEESSLIRQDYLLDDTLSIKELLDLNQIEVIGFQRFACGETMVAPEEKSLDAVEVCQ